MMNERMGGDTSWSQAVYQLDDAEMRLAKSEAKMKVLGLSTEAKRAKTERVDSEGGEYLLYETDRVEDQDVWAQKYPLFAAQWGGPYRCVVTAFNANGLGSEIVDGWGQTPDEATADAKVKMRAFTARMSAEAKRYSDVPLVCDRCGSAAVTSIAGGKEGHTMLCPDCRDAPAEPHVAKIAKWADLVVKARNIYRLGWVRVIAVTPLKETGQPWHKGEEVGTVTAEVRGDHSIYLSSITREPGSKRVGMWECSCPWASYSWARTRQWKKYEGRMCSHVLALLYEAQAQEMFGDYLGLQEEYEEPVWRTHDPTFYTPPDRVTAKIGAFRDVKVKIRNQIINLLDILDAGHAIVEEFGEVAVDEILYPTTGDLNAGLRYIELDRVGKQAVQREGDERAYGKYLMRYSTSDQGERRPRHIIEVFDGSTKIGELNWYGTTGTIHHIGVEEEYSRQGIATAMWEWGKEMRPRPRHSNDQTTQGSEWAKSVGAAKRTRRIPMMHGEPEVSALAERSRSAAERTAQTDERTSIMYDEPQPALPVSYGTEEEDAALLEGLPPEDPAGEEPLSRAIPDWRGSWVTTRERRRMTMLPLLPRSSSTSRRSRTSRPTRRPRSSRRAGTWALPT